MSSSNDGGDNEMIRALPLKVGLEGSGHHFMSELFEHCARHAKRDSSSGARGKPFCRNPFGPLFYGERHVGGLLGAATSPLGAKAWARIARGELDAVIATLKGPAASEV